MVSALQITALANVLVGITAIGLGRKLADPAKVQSSATTATPVAASADPARSMRWVTLLVALTGAVSMGLEVLASRSLALIFGASLQAFAVVLMAFILGIGAGSAAVASPRLKRWRNEGAVIVLLLSAAGIVGLLVMGIEQWVEAYRHVRLGLAPSRIAVAELCEIAQHITGQDDVSA